nr:type II toxin-antitoxin system HicB family antitoxin [Mycobacterium marseillense]
MADRHYSGTIVVRTTPELHSRLVVEAAEQGVSMNQWVVQQLAGRRPSDTFGLSGWD